jgi:hypothetical protein
MKNANVTPVPIVLALLLAFPAVAIAQGNTITGVDALHSNTTGSANTATGYGALFSNTTGNANVGTGFASLYFNTAGVNNTATGYAALYSNTTGISNTAAGYNALYSNNTGRGNVATGLAALYFNTAGVSNTATGYAALYSNNTGNGNVAAGYNALYSNTTGFNNTAAGYAALYFNKTGSYNTAVGLNAGPDQNSPNLTNATAIGANAIVSRSNALVLGGAVGSGWAVNVGIGTATPTAALDVVGTLKLEGSGSGIAFPDGTNQTTAIKTGPQGPPGLPGYNGCSCSAICWDGGFGTSGHASSMSDCMATGRSFCSGYTSTGLSYGGVKSLSCN